MSVATTEALAERVERLEARAQIGELLADYAFGCDNHDADRFVNAFTEDGYYYLGGRFGSVTGHDEIRKVLEEIWEASPETHHWITDITVDFTGAESATGEAHTICHVKNAEGRDLFVSCNYDNEYERRDGAWRMKTCRMDVHWWKVVEMETVS